MSPAPYPLVEGSVEKGTTMLQSRASWIRGTHRAGHRKHCRCGDHRHGNGPQERRRARRREDRTWRREYR